jgi:hypothetical protein
MESSGQGIYQLLTTSRNIMVQCILATLLLQQKNTSRNPEEQYEEVGHLNTNWPRYTAFIFPQFPCFE